MYNQDSEAVLVRPMFPTERANRIRQRLKIIEGQVRGIARMVEDDRPCLEILTQLAASQEAMSQVGKLVMRNYLETCVTDALQSGSPEEQAKTYDDLLDVMSKYWR